MTKCRTSHHQARNYTIQYRSCGVEDLKDNCEKWNNDITCVRSLDFTSDVRYYNSNNSTEWRCSIVLKYESPTFNFAAPLELARRAAEEKIPSQPYRTSFMRDRDRVMYCSAFRRLAGKTQIYLTGKDDHRRNRLTHTLEVSQIARTISSALKLDCDLTEAIALAHDLGHTPFGHAGEQILHEIMVPNSKITLKNSPMNNPELSASAEIKKALFGFKHNVQSVRVAATLETNYEKAGLNLTNFTLWGILHHSSLSYKPGKVATGFLDPNYRDYYTPCLQLHTETPGEAWSFEAFVVAQADEIAQWHHDLEDALRGNAMTSSDVCKTILQNLAPIMTSEDKENLNRLKIRKQISKKYVTDLSRIVVNTLVNRLIECSLYNLNRLWEKHIKTSESRSDFFSEHSWSDPEIQNAISFEKSGLKEAEIDSLTQEYPSIISEKIHHSRDVERMNAKGQYIIKKLFQAYFSHPQQLPNDVIVQYMIDMGQYTDLDSASKVGAGGVRIKFENYVSNKTSFSIAAQIALMRKICDHIAGMTDHYAMEEYENLYG